MPSILDEIAADQDPRLQCRVCSWIREQPVGEQSQWDAATINAADKKFTKSSLHRAIRRRGGEHVKSIDGHVDNRHQAGK